MPMPPLPMPMFLPTRASHPSSPPQLPAPLPPPSLFSTKPPRSFFVSLRLLRTPFCQLAPHRLASFAPSPHPLALAPPPHPLPRARDDVTLFGFRHPLPTRLQTTRAPARRFPHSRQSTRVARAGPGATAQGGREGALSAQATAQERSGELSATAEESLTPRSRPCRGASRKPAKGLRVEGDAAGRTRGGEGAQKLVRNRGRNEALASKGGGEKKAG